MAVSYRATRPVFDFGVNCHFRIHSRLLLLWSLETGTEFKVVVDCCFLPNTAPTIKPVKMRPFQCDLKDTVIT